MTFRDLLIYGVACVSPISAWGTFAYVHSLASGAVMLAYTAGIVCLCFTAQSYGWMVLFDYILMPAIGIVTIVAAMTQMNANALWLGLGWLVLGVSIATARTSKVTLQKDTQ